MDERLGPHHGHALRGEPVAECDLRFEDVEASDRQGRTGRPGRLRCICTLPLVSSAAPRLCLRSFSGTVRDIPLTGRSGRQAHADL